MAKVTKDTTRRETAQAKPPETAKPGASPDSTLSEEELRKVTGGPIYMTGAHGTGGGGGAG